MEICSNHRHGVEEKDSKQSVTSSGGYKSRVLGGLEAVALTTDVHLNHKPPTSWIGPLRPFYTIIPCDGFGETLSRPEEEQQELSPYMRQTTNNITHTHPLGEGLLSGEIPHLVILHGDVQPPVAGARTSGKVSRTCVEETGRGSFLIGDIIL